MVVAGVVGWALHTGLHSRLRRRFSRASLASAGILAAAAAGVYTGFVLTFTDKLNVILSPTVGGGDGSCGGMGAVSRLPARIKSQRAGICLHQRRRSDPGGILRLPGG